MVVVSDSRVIHRTGILSNHDTSATLRRILTSSFAGNGSTKTPPERLGMEKAALPTARVAVVGDQPEIIDAYKHTTFQSSQSQMLNNFSNAGFTTDDVMVVKATRSVPAN